MDSPASTHPRGGVLLGPRIVILRRLRPQPPPSALTGNAHEFSHLVPGDSRLGAGPAADGPRIQGLAEAAGPGIHAVDVGTATPGPGARGDLFFEPGDLPSTLGESGLLVVPGGRDRRADHGLDRRPTPGPVLGLHPHERAGRRGSLHQFSLARPVVHRPDPYRLAGRLDDRGRRNLPDQPARLS